MASVTYAIVFNGEIVEGFEIISVKAHMAKMLKADADKMQTLFSGKPIVLKRTADKAEAAKYGTALKKVGANVRVKIIKSDAAAQPAKPKAATPGAEGIKPPTGKAPTAKAPKAKAPQAKAPAAKEPAGDFSLRPNEGNLFEPEPEVEAPELDLRGFSVAENDGEPLIEPKVYEEADIDLSEFSVAENDGSPIVEPSPEHEKVEAPDFGLDEPGAVLETLKEDVELLDPDTSGMSLAFPGTDLLNEDEKAPPPPKGPDTSKIKLVSNFDT